jgi:AraC-like DNA-binding protein
MPHPELAMHVRRYNGYDERSFRPVRRREPPSGEVALIISLGPHHQLIDPVTGSSLATLRSFVAGLDDTYSVVESGIPGLAIQVDFTPIGARQVLQLPMHLVSKRTVELSDLFGSEANRLIEQLFEAPDWHSRFVMLDKFLISKIRQSAKPVSEVDWAWRQLENSHGVTPIQGITEHLGWTRKRLIKAFRQEVGIPPKVLARILRFRWVLAELKSRKVINLSQLAAECGYSDQSHMIRDCKDLSGWTPVELVRFYSPETGFIES